MTLRKKSLKEIAYETIKLKIIDCEYPPNFYLNESILMAEVGTSRTPIREALNRLEQENLITIMPKKGVLVSEMSLSEIHVIYETRLLIEPYIIKNYAHSLDEKTILELRDRLTAIIDSNNMQEIYRVDDYFHQIIINSCKNKYLMQTMDHIYDQNHRLRILSGKLIIKRLGDSHIEHLQIIENMLNKNFDEAANAMQDHLNKSKQAALKVLLANGSRL